MLALIADADRFVVATIERAISALDVETVRASDGAHAWQLLHDDPRIALAVVDWDLPGMSSLDLCRALRSRDALSGVYVLLMVPRHRRGEIVAGLQAGADDYMSKPLDLNEMQSRVSVALRILALQHRLSDRVEELHAASSNLHGLMPICSYCKQVHPEAGHWQEVDDYIATHSELKFTHHICPRCYADAVKDLAAR